MHDDTDAPDLEVWREAARAIFGRPDPEPAEHPAPAEHVPDPSGAPIVSGAGARPTTTPEPYMSDRDRLTALFPGKYVPTTKGLR